MDFDYDVMENYNEFCNKKIDDIIDKETPQQLDSIPCIEIVDEDSRDGFYENPIKETKKKSPVKKKPSRRAQRKVTEPEQQNNLNENNETIEICDNQQTTAGRNIRKKGRRNRLNAVTNNLSIETSVDLLNEIEITSTATRRRRTRGTRPTQAPNRNNDIICIGSDEENETYLPISEMNKIPNLSTSFSDLEAHNPELSVKIEWLNKIESFTIRKYEKFQKVFEHLAERENTDVNSIFLNLNSTIINVNDTPEQINYTTCDLISGRVLKNNKKILNPNNTKQKKDTIIVKLQSNLWKKPMPFEIGKTEKFNILYIKCSEEFKLPISDFSLLFDGDVLQLNVTPDEMEFDGDEMIDCVIKQKSK